MVRVPLACLLVASAARVAAAGTSHKVTVETTPPGATIYLNDKDSKPVCDTTPCTFDAPVGDTPVIVELDRYDPLIDMITVPKRSTDPKPIKFAFKLSHASATLTIPASSNAKGASVMIDDVDQGKVPVRVELEAGKHHVVVTLSGQKLLDKELTLEVGEERDLPIKSSTTVAVKDTQRDLPGDPPDGGGIGSGSDVKPPPPNTEEPHEQYFLIAPVLDYVARDFSYDGGQGTLMDYRQQESGPLVGGALEIWPLSLMQVGFGSGLSIYGKVGFGVTHQVVEERQMDGMIHPLDARTLWGNLEGSLRYRFTIADTFGIQPQLGFVRDQLVYDAGSDMDLGKVPVADYKSVKAAIRFSALLGSVEPYADLENLIVMSGGDLAKRFRGSTVGGLHGALGLIGHFGLFYARAEGAITSYSWTFTYESGDASIANKATDRLLTLTAALGFTY